MNTTTMFPSMLCRIDTYNITQIILFYIYTSNNIANAFINQ